MKKYFIFAAAAIVAVSCAKTPAPVQTPDGPEAPAVEGKVAVQFGTNVVANVDTKAEGSIDAWDGQQNLYVYGFRRVKLSSTDVADPKNGHAAYLVDDIKNKYDVPFIDNVMATSPATASVDNKIQVLQNSEPYYYDGSNTYDFFGYYVDDAASSIIPVLTPVEQNSVKDSAYVLPIKIDGGQDILLAKASAAYAFDKVSVTDKKTYWTSDGSDWSVSNSTWEEKYAFSAYAARRKVHPYLVFEHQLTQIQFYVTSGTDFTQPNVPKLSVTSVKFLGVETKADLYVASGKIPEGIYNAMVDNTDDDSKNIEVTQATAVGDPTRTALTAVEVPSVSDPAVAIGAPTMLIPNSEYNIIITLSQAATASGADASQPIERTLKIGDVQVKVPDSTGNNPGDSGYVDTWEKISELTPGEVQTKFTAGYSYNVNVKVYGLEKVDITAELVDWKEGGKIDIDTDDKPEF